LKKETRIKETKKELVRQVDRLNDQIEYERQRKTELSNKISKMNEAVSTAESKLQHTAEHYTNLSWSKDVTLETLNKANQLLYATKGIKIETSSTYGYQQENERLIVCEKISSENALIELVGFINGLMLRPQIQSSRSYIDGLSHD